MSTTTSNIASIAEGEPTLFDSLARLVPEELQTAYYRVLAHTRTLSPDDEMLRILEAMGILVLLTRHTPKDIADERERFQELLELHRQFSDDAQQKMFGLVRELEARVSDLPRGIKAGLDPQQIAKMLGESLRQNFLQSGVPETVKGLQATSAAMTGAQKELTTALYNLSDSHGGVVARVEYANNRLERSLESRAKTIDVLLHEWKSDLLRIWIPLVAGAAMLVGLFGGIEIQGCRDAASTVAAPQVRTAPPTATNPELPAKASPRPSRKGAIKDANPSLKTRSTTF